MSVLPAPEERPRDAAVIALAGTAHYASHVMQLALPPLFPLLHDHFAVSFADLGLAMGLFYAASGLGQAAAGVLVDRYGARRLLLGGLVLLSAATALMGLVGSYRMLLALALLAGLGNSVFHPADLSILSHRVSSGRLGRAYAVHGICGTLGFATSPVLVTLIAAFAGWRVALSAVGAGGLAVAAVIYANGALLEYRRRATAHPGSATRLHPAYWRIIGSPVVLMAFTYFALTAFAGTGIQTFSITALVSGYGLELPMATLSLTLYLVGGALGMMVGGFLAERTRQHHRVAMSGIALAAALMLLVSGLPGGTAALPLMMLAGIASGITAPSRDVLIRQAAAGAGMGSVFGFVYSGFDLGSSVAPLLFGALIDRGAPHAVFLAIACAFAVGVPAVMQIRQRAASPVQAPAGAD